MIMATSFALNLVAIAVIVLQHQGTAVTLEPRAQLANTSHLSLPLAHGRSQRKQTTKLTPTHSVKQSVGLRYVRRGPEGIIWNGTKCSVVLHPPLTPYMALSNRWKNLNRSYHFRMVRQYGADALTALDVGAYDPFLLSQLTWVPTKIAMDLQYNAPQRPVWTATRGIIFIQGDILKTTFVGRKFDLVVCSQVVEHIPTGVVEKFVRRMMQVAKTLIVSTTYEMPPGTIHGHVQDPISTQKMLSWFDHSDVPGKIVHYFHSDRNPDPKKRFTIKSMTTGGRVEPMGQTVVWQSEGEAVV